MITLDRDRLAADLRQAYGSPTTPNWSFVSEALRRRPYQPLVDELAAIVSVEENTDPNDDVSFSFVLGLGESAWSLRLSMIGPYALLLRAHPSVVEFLPPEPDERSATERRIVELLASHGVQLLDRDLLEEPVDFAVTDSEADQPRLYQALFSDEVELPWQ